MRTRSFSIALMIAMLSTSGCGPFLASLGGGGGGGGGGDSTAPPVPDLVESSSTFDSVSLSWKEVVDADSGLDKYRVSYSRVDVDSPEAFADQGASPLTTKETNITLNGLPAGQRMLLGLSASDTVGNISDRLDVAITTAAARASGTFDKKSRQLDDEATAVATADLDGDGILDLVVGLDGDDAPQFGGEEANGHLRILLGNVNEHGQGTGTFRDHGAPLAISPNPFDIEILDVNQDRIPDIVVTCLSFVIESQFPESLFVCLGEGGGFFAAPISVPFAGEDGDESPENASSISVGDFNGDGLQDLLLPLLFGNELAVLLGTGTGPHYFVDHNAKGRNGIFRPFNVAIFDFTGDGHLDLAVLKRIDENLSQGLITYRGRGDGTFGLLKTIGLGHRFGHSIVHGDFDGDRIEDLCVTTATLDVPPLSAVRMLKGGSKEGIPNGEFSEEETVTFDTGSDVRSMITADFDGDHIRDLLVADHDPEGTKRWVYLLKGKGSRGQGDGTFTQEIEVVQDGAVQAFVSGDFNGDGLEDAAYVSTTIRELGVLEANGVTATYADAFYPSAQHSLPDGSDAFASYDLNDDGARDLLISSSGRIRLYKTDSPDGQPRGQLGDQGSLDIEDTRALACEDFNADGLKDLAIAVPTGVFIALQKEPTAEDPIRFDSPRQVPAENTVSYVATAEFNGDGAPDLIVCDDLGIYLLLGRLEEGLPNGEFDTATRIEIPNCVSAIPGEIDGRPPSDLIVTTETGLFAFLGQVGGDLVQRQHFTVDTIGTPALADVNEDTVPDLIWLRPEGVQIALGESSQPGRFQVGNTFGIRSQPIEFTAVDLNRDSILDIALIHQDGLSILNGQGTAGRGDGTFALDEGLSFDLQGTPNALLHARHNGDVLEDLFVITRNGNTPTLEIFVSRANYAKKGN